MFSTKLVLVLKLLLRTRKRIATNTEYLSSTLQWPIFPRTTADRKQKTLVFATLRKSLCMYVRCIVSEKRLERCIFYLPHIQGFANGTHTSMLII